MCSVLCSARRLNIKFQTALGSPKRFFAHAISRFNAIPLRNHCRTSEFSGSLGKMENYVHFVFFFFLLQTQHETNFKVET